MLHVGDFAFTPAVCMQCRRYYRLDVIRLRERTQRRQPLFLAVPLPGIIHLPVPGDTYSYIIQVAGDYTYQCNFHPTLMQGTIRAGYALPMVENFDYPAGDTLTNYGGWKNHSGTGTFLTITSGSLTYPGYTASGIGNSVTVNGGSGSREDANKLFHQQSEGAVYAGVLANVVSASTTGDYFFHFAPYFPSTLFRGRVFVKDDGAGNLQFGLSFASTSTVEYTTTTYSYS